MTREAATILGTLDDNVERETTVPVSDVPWPQARRGTDDSFPNNGHL